MYRQRGRQIFGWAASWCLISICITQIACRSTPIDTAISVSPDWTPSHFPPLPETVPPFSDAQLELGRWLFYDVRLSENGTRSCGTCHEQIKAFSDGLVQGLGIENTILPLNTLSLVNVAWRTELTWSDRLEDVETHMRIPLFATNPVEMGMTEALLLERLAQNERYQSQFEAAFPNENAPITVDNAIHAIAAFTYSIVDGQSDYDRWLQGEITLSPEAEQGKALFFGDKMKCGACHGGLFFDQPDPLLTNTDARHGYFNTGLYNIDGDGSYPPHAQGLIAQSNLPEDMGKFRTPSLRNLSLTKPWLHDGTAFTLDSILQAYARGGRKLESGAYPGEGRDNPYKSELISGFSMTEDEERALLSFLNTLDDPYLLDSPRLQSPFCIRQADEIINAPCEEPFSLDD